MNDFNRYNKVAGVYWLKDPIENIKIKVKLKSKNGPISLPKFEDYTTSSQSSIQCDQSQEFTYKWQQKVFSSWELQRYTDVHNCLTDTELTYHNMIENSEYEPSKVFTYIHDDCYLPLPNSFDNDSASVNNLSSCLSKLKLRESVSRLMESSSTGDLFRSEENIGGEQWTSMHVVLDNSEYNEDSYLLLKQEAKLISLYHNTTHNYLILSPDVNDLELNPYSVETSAGLPLQFQYGVEVDLGDRGGSEELVTLLQKLLKKSEKLQRHVVSFAAPPLGRRQSCVTLEVLTGAGFDMNDLYVEYHVQVPDSIQCDGSPHGRTHVSRASRVDQQWAFGYIIELGLEMDSVIEPPPIQIFFEVISTDWWGRHRTEGYSYLPLALTPGQHKKQLSCSRPEEKDRVEGESRRFFVGGCHLIKELEVLARPQLQDTNFTYALTGTLSVRWSVVSQSPTTGARAAPPAAGAAAVLRGAEAVLRQYQRARAKLAAATRDLPTTRDLPSEDL